MSHLKTKGQWKKHQKDQKLTGPGIHKSNGMCQFKVELVYISPYTDTSGADTIINQGKRNVKGNGASKPVG